MPIAWLAQLIISMLYLAIALDQLHHRNLMIAGVYLSYAVAGGLMLTTLR